MTGNQRIIELRGKLTRKEFAEKLQISYVLLSKIETGAKPLSKKLAIQISKMFNVSVDWLYEIDEKKSVITTEVNVNEPIENYVPIHKYLQILEENNRLKDELLKKQALELQQAKNIADVSQ